MPALPFRIMGLDRRDTDSNSTVTTTSTTRTIPRIVVRIVADLARAAWKVKVAMLQLERLVLTTSTRIPGLWGEPVLVLQTSSLGNVPKLKHATTVGLELRFQQRAVGLHLLWKLDSSVATQFS